MLSAVMSPEIDESSRRVNAEKLSVLALSLIPYGCAVGASDPFLGLKTETKSTTTKVCGTRVPNERVSVRDEPRRRRDMFLMTCCSRRSRASLGLDG